MRAPALVGAIPTSSSSPARVVRVGEATRPPAGPGRRGERRHQVAGLEDEADVVAAQRQPPPREGRDVDVVDDDRPGGRPREAPATASRLDLPAPDGPTTATSSPGTTCRSTWSRATTCSAPSPNEGDVVEAKRGGHRLPPKAVTGSTGVMRTMAMPRRQPSATSSSVAPATGAAWSANGIPVEAIAAQAATATPTPSRRRDEHDRGLQHPVAHQEAGGGAYGPQHRDLLPALHGRAVKNAPTTSAEMA